MPFKGLRGALVIPKAEVPPMHMAFFAKLRADPGRREPLPAPGTGESRVQGLRGRPKLEAGHHVEEPFEGLETLNSKP